ncbi:MAG TPA: HlyD family secretion protein, partial [Saprospiraceae bacterium]|nr:HlyD family secretion protein [Saprospiraceae bacterium]
AAQTEEEEDLNVEVKNQGKAANEKTEDNIREVVFVLTGETVAAKEVKTGIQDDTYIQILSGLNVGEQVVTGPYSAVSRKLNDGDKVTLKKEKKKEKE